MTTKVNKKPETTNLKPETSFREALEKLLQKAVIEYEDSCVGTEVENDTHYLYMYDRFELNHDPYYFAKVITSGKHYEPIELSETEKEFLQNELFKVWPRRAIPKKSKRRSGQRG